jgi:hypothetical protein
MSATGIFPAGRYLRDLAMIFLRSVVPVSISGSGSVDDRCPCAVGAVISVTLGLDEMI